MFMRLAQVVFTLTQFPTVDGVNFKLDGKPIDVLGGEGIIIDHPHDPGRLRRHVAGHPGGIAHTGQTVVSSPLRITGTANVFEAVFRSTSSTGTALIIVDETVHGHLGHRHAGHLRRDRPLLGRQSRPRIASSCFSDSPKDGSKVIVDEIPLLGTGPEEQRGLAHLTPSCAAVRGPVRDRSGAAPYLRPAPSGGPRRARSLIALKDERGLQAAGDPQLAEDVVRVRLDRLLRDEQFAPITLLGMPRAIILRISRSRSVRDSMPSTRTGACSCRSHPLARAHSPTPGRSERHVGGVDLPLRQLVEVDAQRSGQHRDDLVPHERRLLRTGRREPVRAWPPWPPG